MSEEIILRDQQLRDLQEDMNEQLDRLAKSKRRELDIDELNDKVRQFRNGIDSLEMELKGLVDDDRKTYKKKYKKHKAFLTTFQNQLEWKTTESAKTELLAGAADVKDVTVDLDSETGLMKYGKDMLCEDDEALKRTLTKVHETKEIAANTAVKIQEQTNEIEGMYDDLYKIDDTVQRSKAIIRRMFRQVRTEKYLWVLIGLVFIAVAVIIVFEFTGLADSDDSDPVRRLL